MGEYKSPSGVKCFTPDNTENKVWIISSGCSSLADIMAVAKRKFGTDVDLDKVIISAEHVHTYALGYDSYDSSDYTDYLALERLPD